MKQKQFIKHIMSLISKLNKEKVIQFIKQSKSKITKKNSLISVSLIGLLLVFKFLIQNYIHTEYFTFDLLCKTVGPEYNDRNNEYHYRFNPYWGNCTDFILTTNKSPNVYSELKQWKIDYEHSYKVTFNRQYFNGNSALISTLYKDRYGQHHKFILVSKGDTYCAIQIFGSKSMVIDTFLKLDKSFEVKD